MDFADTTVWWFTPPHCPLISNKRHRHHNLLIWHPAANQNWKTHHLSCLISAVIKIRILGNTSDVIICGGHTFWIHVFEWEGNKEHGEAAFNLFTLRSHMFYLSKVSLRTREWTFFHPWTKLLASHVWVGWTFRICCWDLQTPAVDFIYSKLIVWVWGFCCFYGEKDIAVLPASSVIENVF